MFERGTIVTVTGRGVVDAVVADFRRLRKGRRAGQCEYTLAPLDFERKGSRPYYIVAPEQLVSACERTYDAALVSAALASQVGVERQREATKRAEAEQNYNADLKLQQEHGCRVEPGDEVLIGYSNGSRWETVGDVRPGKVGIIRRAADQIRERNRRQAVVNYIAEESLGVSIGRRGMRRELRWLGASLVRDVRKAAAAS